MEQMEAARVLIEKYGVASLEHLKSFRCGDEHNPEKARRVLALAEIAWPGKLAESAADFNPS
jgi:hypothetical protein